MVVASFGRDDDKGDTVGGDEVDFDFGSDGDWDSSDWVRGCCCCCWFLGFLFGFDLDLDSDFTRRMIIVVLSVLGKPCIVVVVVVVVAEAVNGVVGGVCDSCEVFGGVDGVDGVDVDGVGALDVAVEVVASLFLWESFLAQKIRGK